jgi:GT2 family glycosyltransferase
MKFSNLGDTIGVPCLVGCFLVCRSEILIKIGGFDPQFFLYLEDYDLCRRIGVNHRVVFYPHATIYHEYARGSYKNTRLLRYHMVSAIQYFFKHGWIFDRRRRSENLLAMKRYSRIDLNS